MGDIHGEYDKLKSCLQSVNFDYENDKLIQLGDVVDRGADSFKCVEELLKIKHLIAIKGNHDECFRAGFGTGNFDLFSQGCRETLLSYIKALDVEIWQEAWNIFPESHKVFFNKIQQLYYIDENNNLFIHGGFNRHHLIDDGIHNTEDVFLWDRDLLAQARSYESMKDKTYPFKTKNDFNEIYIGHTPVQHYENSDKPQQYTNVHLLDTGCGKGGILTIMDLETNEFKQF